jgi:hypothetical protein
MLLPFQCTADDMQWAGLSCTEDQPCPVYLELAAMASAGSKIFAAGNIHSETITLYSVLLASADGGKTWQEAHRRIRGAGLDHLQFSGSETGWAGGEALSPLPQDPFLLITSDGGETWGERAIFDENRIGSIQRLWFRSKTEGELIFDRGEGSAEGRYELYETPNGGQTWMMREESDKPIRVAGATDSDPAWRVRADGPTKSFRLESRQGSQWRSVAAFSVNIGACKPPPISEAAPPDEPASSSQETAPPMATPLPQQPPSLKNPRRQ